MCAWKSIIKLPKYYTNRPPPNKKKNYKLFYKFLYVFFLSGVGNVRVNGLKMHNLF